MTTAPPPATPASIDFGRSFTFTSEDPEWVSKILIGGVFVLACSLLVGVPFVLGYFSRTLDIQILADAGIDPASFKQENQSRSYQGVRRGLHGRSGAGEAKLVRCANGAVLDVVVDARPGSPTFGQVMTFLLDDQVCTQVYIPRGFLHGFQALTAVTDIVYRIDEFHAPNSDVTVRHDDPDLAIPWPAPVTIMSARDREGGISWAEYRRQLGVDDVGSPH